jgi:hypothetical protein
MTRYIIECDDPEDVILGMRLIKRIAADGKKWGCSEFGDSKRKAKLWIAHRTKTGFSARYVDFVAAKRKEKP